MNPFIDLRKLEIQCKNPSFCIVCLRIRDDVMVDRHHVCMDCRKGSTDGMPRRLPAITLENGKTYFIDERLRELRNVHNPHDTIDFDGVVK
jgi:hypothetical protein